MEEDDQQEAGRSKRPAWLIWIYLLPLYVLVAYPIARWVKKVRSGDIVLTSEQASVFNSTQTYHTETPSGRLSSDPRLPDMAYSINYRRNGAHGKKAGTARPAESSGKIPQGTSSGKSVSSRPAKRGSKDSMWRNLEMKTAGYKKGYLTYAVGYAMNKPSAVKKLFDNSLVVKGFMARPTVKSVLNDPQALQEFLTQTPAVNNFLGNSVVQKALSNPAIVNAVASSKLAESILNSPAIQQLISNPEMLKSLIESNPQVAELLANPLVINALASNPSTQDIYSQLGKIQ